MKVESKYYFSPLKKRQKLDKNLKIVSLDSEYNELTKELKIISISQLLHRNNKFEYETFSSFNTKEIVDYIICKNLTLIYCFNLSADITFILSELVRQHIEYNIVESSKMLGISFKVNKKRFIIKDFFPYALTSLEEFAKVLNCNEKKYPNIDSKEKWLEFFKTCNIEELKKHNIQDTKMLCESIFRFRQMIYDKFNVDFMNKKIYSLASLSLKIFRTKFLKYKLPNPFFKLYYDIYQKSYSIELDRELYNYVRLSYKGGYVDCISNTLHKNIYCYDRNSAHPHSAVLIKYFPIGKSYKTKYLKEFLLRTKLIAGFCNVEIDFSSSKQYYIPINITDEKGNVKFKRCFTKEKQIITSIELKYLIEHNISFKFIDGIYFKQYDKSFSLYNFYITFYNDRKLLDEFNPFKLILKIIMNALYGKFGQKVDCEKVINYPFDSMQNAEHFLNSIDNANEIKQLNENLFIVSQKVNSEMHKSFMIVSWASLITAMSRIMLLDKIHETKAIMWDSDSVYCEQKNVSNNFIDSNELGGWKLEKICSEFRCIAPKLYAYTYYDKKHDIWKKEVKAKGVPKDLRIELYDSIISGKSELKVNNIIKILSYKECCRNIKSTYQSDLFVKVLETSKTLIPQLKYTFEELQQIYSSDLEKYCSK